MLIVSKKRHGVNIIDCWYAKQPIKEKGIVRYMEAGFPDTGSNQEQFRTLLTDLTESEEEIIGKYTKNCRYEVRRAPKEGISCEFYVGQELLKENRIEEFVDFFEKFWNSKGIDFTERQKCQDEITEYAKHNAFAISIAKDEAEKLVYHTYIVDENWVRLYQSASQFRSDNMELQKKIGFANRYLHKEDMMFFKQQGKVCYDWGGAGLNEEVASITHFKESFGGKEAIFYNGQTANGAAGKAYEKTVSILNKF